MVLSVPELAFTDHRVRAAKHGVIAYSMIWACCDFAARHAQKFLQGQLSNDVGQLSAGDAVARRVA
jgi:hypothetical protein